MNTTACGYCKKNLIGRTDKQFCNDRCRVAFHNNRKNTDYGNDYIRMINAFIKKNRNILKEIFEQEFTPVHSQDLLIRGFCYSFFTHESVLKSGDRYLYCYDYGYLINKEGFVIIIKTNSRV